MANYDIGIDVLAVIKIVFIPFLDCKIFLDNDDLADPGIPVNNNILHLILFFRASSMNLDIYYSYFYRKLIEEG